MSKFQLLSGKIVELSIAPMPQALNLYRHIVLECKGANLDITRANEKSIGELLTNNIEALLNIVSSQNVINAIVECCDKVIYNNKRFSMELFEEESARADFFGLMLLVACENIRPFFPALHSVFSVLETTAIK